MAKVSAPTSAVIRLAADVRLSGSSETMVVETVLAYSVKEPFEVTLSFQTAGGVPSVVWRFARDLLIEARVEGESGEGDVHVDWSEDDCELHLFGNSDRKPTEAVVVLPGRRIGTFLSRITRMVPAGAESRMLSVPSFLPVDW